MMDFVAESGLEVDSFVGDGIFFGENLSRFVMSDSNDLALEVGGLLNCHVEVSFVSSSLGGTNGKGDVV